MQTWSTSVFMANLGKKLKWINLLFCVLCLEFADAKGTYSYPHYPQAYYPVTSINSKICHRECMKWKPKECWDGYLKRKVWKMVCENYKQTCCPGYEGPNCERVCFDCDKINGLERRFIDVYEKIQILGDKCSNQTACGGGGGGNEGSGDSKDCTCPAGPRGHRGPVGPIGPPGIPGPQGVQGPQGPAGDPGPQGPPGQQGLDGLPGSKGFDGRSGLPGEKGDRGPRGAPGLSGEAGLPGQKGSPGVDGLPGNKGEPGQDGLPGSVAAKGARGPKGNRGDPGATGERGYIGEPGIPGPEGPRGPKGDMGTQGWPGIEGQPGQKGERGVRGFEGVSGQPGEDGQKGEQGEPGLPGRQGRPGDITRVEESRVVIELINTVQTLERKLETTRREIEELRVVCNSLTRCQLNCSSSTFRCNCGMCIPYEFQCDGFPQCPDGSDEDPLECGYCSTNEFKCEASGSCIPIYKQCNGVPDCPDASDESQKHCSTVSCLEGDFACRDGSKCLKREERCDGKSDCVDGSDEEECDCPSGQFKCVSVVPVQCISASRVCDSIPDCDDRSDESSVVCDTGISCNEGQRACRDNSGCYTIGQICDGSRDCFDGSDEINCGTIIINTTTPTPTLKTTEKTTSTTSSSTTITTTTTIPTTSTDDEDIKSGSGDVPSDDIREKTCRELYDAWVDPDFPGGRPPPLSKDEKISKDLCEFLKTQQLLNPRQKRHRITGDEQDNIQSDDASRVSYMNDDNTVLSDLSFVEDEDKVAKTLDGGSKAEVAAVKGTKSDCTQHVASSIAIVFSCAISFIFILI